VHISGIDVRLIKDGVVGLLSFNEFPEEAETFILVNFWANLNSKCVIHTEHLYSASSRELLRGGNIVIV